MCSVHARCCQGGCLHTRFCVCAACQPWGWQLWQLSQSAPACTISARAACDTHCNGCIYCKTEAVWPKQAACKSDDIVINLAETPAVTNFGFVHPFPPPATACAALSLADRWCDLRVTSIYSDARIYAAVSTPVRAELSCVISDGEPETQSTAEKASGSTV